MSIPKNGSRGPIWTRENTGGATPGTDIIGAMVFPANINVADPAAMADNQASQLSMDASGRLRCLVTAASGVTFTTVPGAFQSVGATAFAAAPVAGQAIVTIAAGSLPAGTYDVTCFAHFQVGAPVAVDKNNMELREGATSISGLQVLPIINAYSPARVFRIILDGTASLSINAIAGGTAGVEYCAELIATRVA